MQKERDCNAIRSLLLSILALHSLSWSGYKVLTSTNIKHNTKYVDIKLKDSDRIKIANMNHKNTNWNNISGPLKTPSLKVFSLYLYVIVLIHMFELHCAE